jgi:hypothetical protein
VDPSIDKENRAMNVAGPSAQIDPVSGQEVRVIVLRDRVHGIVEKVQLIQDGLAALLLLQTGYTHWQLAAGGHSWLGGFELAFGAATALFVVRALAGRESESRIGWVSLLTGMTLLIESLVWTAHGHKLIRPPLLAGITGVVLGLFNRPLARRRETARCLRLDADVLHWRGSRLRRFRAAATDIVCIAAWPDRVEIRLQHGRARRLRLWRYANGEEIRAALLDWARSRGIDTRVEPAGTDRNMERT